MKAKFKISRTMYYVIVGATAERKAEGRKPWRVCEAGESGLTTVEFLENGTYTVETGTAFVMMPSTSDLLDSFEVFDWIKPSDIVVREVANG